MRSCATGAYCGTMQQTRKRRECILSRTLPPNARFDREKHLHIHQAIHTHLSQDPGAALQCEGPGGDLFFAICLAKSHLTAFPRYPQGVQWM